MEPFHRHTGIVATLDRSNIDTDAIIPKQYLKSIRRTGFGDGLFADWRYLSDGSVNPAFELNLPAFKGASILLTRHNFGCGSSREHAVWAVRQYGFRVVLATSRGSGPDRVPAFADIFLNNSVKNGLLCIELTSEVIDQLFACVRQAPGCRATVDLESQTVWLPVETSTPIAFDIDPGVKETLLNGLDDITRTLGHQAAITAFEANHQTWMPTA